MHLKKLAFIGLMMVLFSAVVCAKSPKIKLQKDEKLFRSFSSYTLKDFNFHWDIRYLDVVVYETEMSDGTTFKLPSKITFRRLLKAGDKKVKFSHKRQVQLAKALFRFDYFWKEAYHPMSIFGFTTIRFLEKGDPIFKAISDRKDIRDMLGDIDTEAELALWLLALNGEHKDGRSYKKIENLYRVHSWGLSPFSCYYTEYYRYYNKSGKMVKKKKLKEYHKKGCYPIIL